MALSKRAVPMGKVACKAVASTECSTLAPNAASCKRTVKRI